MAHNIIVGASSAIAQALAAILIEKTDEDLVLISRSPKLPKQCKNDGNRVSLLDSDYSEKSIEKTVNALPKNSDCRRVFIFNGQLHHNNMQPEKKLEDFNLDNFNQVIASNTLTPMLWIRFLVDHLKHPTPCLLTVLSARVGSISDNKLGGWYSYRASKAALNMLLKTASIEYARRAKNVRFNVFHPGTTDTPLSKPFQKNVPHSKLFTPEFVAKCLFSLTQKRLDNMTQDNKIEFYDWQNKPIDW
ncbi:SDR family NAD(P)-dependent oxidoreductase [Thalassotalea aquiviva]|uniref:SDR family NAD(P)-dependent oxidoreductase n=1 Tax=Thalassotalea aquiviva TaxID=3242415 RepID=UPI00352B321D